MRLSECLGRPVRVETVARPGAGIAWARGQAAAVVRTRPDLVLMEFAINDADLRDGTRLDRADAATRAVIGGLRTAPGPAPRVVLMTMNPVEGPRRWLRPRLPRHYDGYRRIAREEGTGLVDLHPRWLAAPRDARGLGADGLHPSRDAVHAIALPAIAAYVARAAGGTCPV